MGVASPQKCAVGTTQTIRPAGHSRHLSSLVRLINRFQVGHYTPDMEQLFLRLFRSLVSLWEWLTFLSKVKGNYSYRTRCYQEPDRPQSSLSRQYRTVTRRCIFMSRPQTDRSRGKQTTSLGRQWPPPRQPLSEVSVTFVPAPRGHYLIT
ncbi:hypothetical protein J6590_000518 [Homalodisca vitripennis]|nr:hypothetical protein J6590_000518 [Homalodisca vitripennis]